MQPFYVSISAIISNCNHTHVCCYILLFMLSICYHGFCILCGWTIPTTRLVFSPTLCWWPRWHLFRISADRTTWFRGDQFSSVDPWLKQKPTRCGPKSPRSPREVIRQSLNAFDWTLSDPRSPKSSGSSGYRTPLSALSQITEIDEMSYK